MAQHEVTITLIAHDDSEDKPLKSSQREDIDAMASSEARNLLGIMEEISPDNGCEVIVTRQRRVTLSHHGGRVPSHD